MAMTREQMLDRMMASDPDYDRAFITGVLSTGIYCLPSCRARKPKPENIRFFRTVDEARSAGLRACKKCRPDDYFIGTDFDLDRLDGAVAFLRERPGEFAGADDLGEAAGMGISKLFEAIRRHYHTTPGEIIARCRVDAACRRLLNSDSGVADIAFEVGFETLSTFYEHFARLTGMAPTAYRRLNEGQSFFVDLPADFLPQMVLAYFGRDPQSLCERVSGNELLLSTNFAEGPGWIRLALDNGRAECEAHGGTTVEAHRGAARILGLRQDPRAFEQLAAKLGCAEMIQGRSGLRIPLTLSHFDAVVWSILGQQVNLAFAYSLRRRLAELAGTPLEHGLVSPPTPDALASLSPESLTPLQFSRRKAEYLIGISQQIVQRVISLEVMELSSATRAERTLLAIRGLGPWSVNYLMMRGLGFADCLPVGDTGLSSALQRRFGLESRPDGVLTRQLMAPFSPHRSLACLHLWQSLRFES